MKIRKNDIEYSSPTLERIVSDDLKVDCFIDERTGWFSFPSEGWVEVKEEPNDLQPGPSENKKNVFVYIRGSKTRGEEVIKALLDLGGVNYFGLEGNDEKYVYFIRSTGIIHFKTIDDSFNNSWLKTYYTEIFLPKEEHKFKPFDKVL